MTRLRFHQKDGSSSIASRALGLMGILLVALLTYLSVDPEAHERIHHDADGPDHHCVITTYTAGEALFVAPLPLVRPETRIFGYVPWQAQESLRAAVDWVLLPSCGPPAAALSV
jgi:hypothetical protein